jgi:lipopolysaccharide transport system permease protein
MAAPRLMAGASIGATTPTIMDSTLQGASPSNPITSRPEPTVVITPRRGLLDLDLEAVWQYRDLLYFLVWRDVKIRYKQTAIGVAWVILQPLLTMILFSLVFGKLGKIPSDGLPYPVFIYSALLPWNLFSSSLSRGGDSVVQNASLVSKIYFPRLILPSSAILSPLLDFAISFVLLIAMILWFGTTPGWVVLALPLFVLLTVLTALAVGLWLSALNVRYRDVGHAIPFLIQLWMFASPVAYPASMIPAQWRLLYGLNPMAGVIEGFRWALLGTRTPHFGVMAISAVMVVVLLVPGLVYFRYTERTFADVV